ncbi:hypothetical protein O181_089906 [Austropuccinia psidii MF-1]|uniref:Uncharacterized protein n=1 Tax=Austropuccinia psidii MF-1 TaxID=1389203 RepID=A0A9Q3P899_9BASI|nr:hypothetical protein [Austropuccinia psidii MF-1]
MSNGCKPTHGFEIVLISHILEEVSKQQKSTYKTNGLFTDDLDDDDNMQLPTDLPPGQIYGSQRCMAGLPVSGIDNNDTKEVKLELLANTNRSNALQAVSKHYAPVRISKRVHENIYIGVYNPQCTAFLGLVNETCVEY